MSRKLTKRTIEAILERHATSDIISFSVAECFKSFKIIIYIQTIKNGKKISNNIEADIKENESLSGVITKIKKNLRIYDAEKD